MAESPSSVSNILERLIEVGDQQDRVRVGDIVKSLGTRSYGPVLVVPALLGISPIGGIPGVPTFLAITVILIAVQMIFGSNHLWLPDFIKDRSVEGEKLANASEDMQTIGRWMDKLFFGRLRLLTGPLAAKAAAIIIIVLCLAVPPLELFPFVVAAPMSVIAAFGIALTVRDGLLMLIAFLGSGGALYLVITRVIMDLLLGGGSP